MVVARILHIRPLGASDLFAYAETTAGRAIIPLNKNLLKSGEWVEIVPFGHHLTEGDRVALGIPHIHPSRLSLPIISNDFCALQPIGLPLLRSRQKNI